MKRPRAGLFLKYLAFIVLLVSAGLIASGAIGLYFSYQETRNALVSLQREKALTAAVRIEQFLRDIEGQLGWTALPLVSPGQKPMPWPRACAGKPRPDRSSFRSACSGASRIASWRSPWSRSRSRDFTSRWAPTT